MTRHVYQIIKPVNDYAHYRYVTCYVVDDLKGKSTYKYRAS